MSSRNRLESVNELDLLIRKSLRASVHPKRPALDLRQVILRRAAERKNRRLLWLPIAAGDWTGEPRYSRWSDEGWDSQVYLCAPRLFKFMGFPSQIL